MRKLVVLVAIGLALAALGCAGSEIKTKSEEPVTSETKVKCPKCGAEFSVGEGMKMGTGP